MSPLLIVQANIGTDVRDMLLPWKASKKPKSAQELNALWDEAEVAYPKIEKSSSDTLNGLNAQVYLMQEVGGAFKRPETRPLIQSLKARNFEVIGNRLMTVQRPTGRVLTPMHPDAIIALDSSRFCHIINLSQQVSGVEERRDVAIATAIDKISKKRCLFVSFHNPGFSFKAAKKYNSLTQRFWRIFNGLLQTLFGRSLNPTEDEREYLKRYRECAHMIDNLSKLIKRIQDREGTEVVVIGADMNATPENSPSLFEQFRKLQLKVVRVNGPTEVNPSDEDPELTYRELDYFFTSSHIKSTNIPIPQMSFEDLQSNASDHLPIAISI